MPNTSIYKRYWPMIVMAVLALFTLTGSAYNAYESHRKQEIPEFDEPTRATYYQYGRNDKIGYVEASGTAFWDFHENYRIAAACAVFSGESSPLDTTYLQIGQQYDIIQAAIPMIINFTPQMNAVAHANKAAYLILLIPKDVTSSQITTLRSARALGVKIKTAGTV